ncbi:MAG: hypothetical protein CM1200mP12_05020 [Gammaproteobacteria bacterium]|nr:MAG: hypothetical protein CM1200mP12_05020 [Gammaproteobacteria bacterium]
MEFMKRDSGDLSDLDMAGFKETEHEEIPYRFIKSGVYGTRCTTLLTINPNGKYRITEQNYSKRGDKTRKIFPRDYYLEISLLYSGRRWIKACR